MGRGSFKMNFLWLLLCFLPSVISQTGCRRNKDRFQREPADTELNEGEIGSLYCIIADDGRNYRTCSWHKDGFPIEIQNPYNFIGRQNEGDCSIQITNSSIIRDDGLWACVRPMQTPHSTNCILSRNATYRVLRKPHAPFMRVTYDSSRVTNGSQLGMFSFPITPSPTIECRCEGGNPLAKLKFLTSLPTERHFHTYNFTTGIKGINLTAISVLRLPLMKETWYGHNISCVAEHQLLNQSVYLNIVKPGESHCSSLESSMAYLVIGALLLIVIGAGFGALFVYFYRKRKVGQNAHFDKDSGRERIGNGIISVDENEDSSSKLERVEYTSLAYPKPTKIAPSQQSPQNELCYAELDMKVLNNARKH